VWEGLQTEGHTEEPYHQQAYRQHKRGTVVITIYHVLLCGWGFTQKGTLLSAGIPSTLKRN